MDQQPLQHIQSLMKEEKFDEARQALSDYIRSDTFITEQTGGAYLSLYMTYLSVLTEARKEYNEALDVGIALLKAANKREQEMKDGIDLAQLQHEVDKLKH